MCGVMKRTENLTLEAVMKALVRSIVMLLIMVPLAVNAAPAKKPGKHKGHKGKQSEVVKKGKHQNPNKPVYVGTPRPMKKRGHSAANVVVHVDSFHFVDRVISDVRLARLLRKLDRARGPMVKLEILARASSHRFFTTRQARRILREFRNEQVRLEALKILRTRIVDQRNFRKLVRAFNSFSAKRRAAGMLAAL
jgi:hypothetical protein